MNFGDKVKAFSFEQASNYMDKEPEKNIPKLAGLVDCFLPKEEFSDQLQAVMSVMKIKTIDCSGLYKCMSWMRVQETPSSAISFGMRFFCWPERERNPEKCGCTIPWAILLDFTSACNLKCTGCWASE